MHYYGTNTTYTNQLYPGLAWPDSWSYLPTPHFYTGIDKTSAAPNNKFDITDVEIIVPNKVVRVTFGDGSQQKAVCQEGDVFSLEEGITVCLCKQYTGGSSSYNNTVSKAVKLYNDKLTKKKAEEYEQARIANKIAKNKAKAEERKKRKESESINKQIEIQKEAYILAMRELGSSK